MTQTTAAPLALSDDAQELLFRSARTANSFTDEPVSDEQMQAIYDLIKWAPTSMNLQALRIVLVRSPEARAKLVDHMADGNKAKTGDGAAGRDARRRRELPRRAAPHVPALPRRA